MIPVGCSSLLFMLAVSTLSAIAFSMTQRWKAVEVEVDREQERFRKEIDQFRQWLNGLGVRVCVKAERPAWLADSVQIARETGCHAGKLPNHRVMSEGKNPSMSWTDMAALFVSPWT